MLKIIKYKIILFTLTVTALAISALTICLGVLEIYAEFRNRSLAFSVYKVLIFSIFVAANISVFAQTSYMSLYALRGFRSTWVMGCHYFLYVLSELVAALIIFTEFDKLNYPVGLSLLAGLLFVLLFFVTCSIELIFSELEYIIEEQRKRFETILEKKRKGVDCIRINLHTDVNIGAGPSRVTK